CLYGAVSRTSRYFGRNRPELPAGCPARLSLDALASIWNFERDAAPLIEVALQAHGLANSTVIIQSRKAATRFAALRA
ncbi:DNA topology modulation protein FlaR, partial [Rhizobium leguminosarum]